MLAYLRVETSKHINSHLKQYVCLMPNRIWFQLCINTMCVSQRLKIGKDFCERKHRGRARAYHTHTAYTCQKNKDKRTPCTRPPSYRSEYATPTKLIIVHLIHYMLQIIIALLNSAHNNNNQIDEWKENELFAIFTFFFNSSFLSSAQQCSGTLCISFQLHMVIIPK